MDHNGKENGRLVIVSADSMNFGIFFGEALIVCAWNCPRSMLQ